MEISKLAILDKVLPLITQQFVDQWLVDVNLDKSLEMVGISLERIDHLNKISKSRITVKLFLIDLIEALAKFRSGTAPMALEIGRYNGSALNDGKCFHCSNVI